MYDFNDFSPADREKLEEVAEDFTENELEELIRTYREYKTETEEERIQDFINRKFIEPYGDNAEKVFEAVMRDAICSGANGKEVVLKRFLVLSKVFYSISEITGEKAKLKLYPSFTAGSVTIETPELHLDKRGAQKLKETLSECNTFEIYPLTNGKVRASATVKGVFESTK